MAKLAVAPKTEPARITELNKRADHFEALVEARFFRAMKELQETIPASELRLVRINGRRTTNPLLLKRIERVLEEHMKDVMTRAFLRGGNLGQMIVNELL